MNPCIRSGARLASAVAILSLTQVTAQRPVFLKPEQSVEVVLGANKQVKVRLAVKKANLTRVLVTALGDAGKPSLRAKIGSRAVSAETYQFQQNYVLEWPAARSGNVLLAISGRTAGDRYRVKFATTDIPRLKPEVESKVRFDLAIVPTAWRRVSLQPKADYKLGLGCQAPGDVNAAVVSADGSKVRHSASGRTIKWTSGHKEDAFLRMRRPLSHTGAINVRLSRTSRPMMLLREASIVEEPPPPPPAALKFPLDRVCQVEKGEEGVCPIYLGTEYAGKTVIVETVGGTMKDPTLCVWGDMIGELLRWDDDSGVDANAKLRVTVPESGDMKLVVRGFGAGMGGSVKIRCHQPK